MHLATKIFRRRRHRAFGLAVTVRRRRSPFAPVLPAFHDRNDKIAPFTPVLLPMERYRKDADTLDASLRRKPPASAPRFTLARCPWQGFGASLSPRVAGFLCFAPRLRACATLCLRHLCPLQA